MPAMRFQVNGREHVVEDLDPATPLLWVLRDHLGLVGSKFGCGMGLCGACTVHLDGAPVRSCTVSAEAVGDKPVTTIEGLADEDKLHVLQEAWVKLDVAQCGYCQAGQIMSAAALLEKESHPSRAQIEQAVAGNLCRCGTYNRIFEAVVWAARTLNGREGRS